MFFKFTSNIQQKQNVTLQHKEMKKQPNEGHLKFVTEEKPFGKKNRP